MNAGSAFTVYRGNHHYLQGVDKQEYRDWETIRHLSAYDVEYNLRLGNFPPGLWIETPLGTMQVAGPQGQKQRLVRIMEVVRIS